MAIINRMAVGHWPTTSKLFHLSFLTLCVLLLFLIKTSSTDLNSDGGGGDTVDADDDSSGIGNSTDPTESNKTTIDWAQVEARFNQYLNDDEIRQKWLAMEENMKSGVRSALRAVFPKIVAMAADAKVSNNCSAGILKWIVNIRHMKSWALKMLDAMGKPPSGIFEGVVTMFGNYDECLKIRVRHQDGDDDDDDGEEEDGQGQEFFRGQYCVTEFKPWLPKKPNFYGINAQYKFPGSRPEDDTIFGDFVKMSLFFHFITFRVDICVPSTCTRDDMQKVATLMANLAEFRARVLRCKVDTGDEHSYMATADWWIFTIISFLAALIMALIMAATAADLNRDRISHRFQCFVRVFSLGNSWRLLTTATVGHRNYHRELSAVQTFRAGILVWIIIVHTFIIVDFQYFREMQTLKSWATKWPSAILTNSLFQFDCLILATAFTFGYCNIFGNRKRLIEFLAKRYLKLVILMALVIGATIMASHLILPGPLTEDFFPDRHNCQAASIWHNFLFIQNFTNQNCLPHTWIFCVEFQLMLLLSPLLSLCRYANRFKWMFWLALPVLLAAGFLYNFLAVYQLDLPPTYYWTLPDKQQRHRYFSEYYHKPLAHLSVFVIGFYAGVWRKLSNKYQNHILIYRNFNHLGIVLSMATILSFTFGFHSWIIQDLPDRLTSALYNACQNIGLGLAYAWILFSVTAADHIGSSGSANNWNSTLKPMTAAGIGFHSPFIRSLGKITLAAYMILPLLQNWLLASQQQPIYSSATMMAYVIIGNLVLTFATAAILLLFAAIPIRLLCHSLFNYLLLAFINTTGPVEAAASETGSATTVTGTTELSGDNDSPPPPEPPAHHHHHVTSIELNLNHK